MRLASCDPGKQGAIAVFIGHLFRGVHLVEVFDMPITADGMIDAVRVYDILTGYEVDTSVIELPWFANGNASQSNGKAGIGWGQVYAAAQIAGCEIHTVEPRLWKGALGLPSKDKEASRALAHQRWPGSDQTWCRRKKDHDRAEAALLGDWWMGRSAHHPGTG